MQICGTSEFFRVTVLMLCIRARLQSGRTLSAPRNVFPAAPFSATISKPVRHCVHGMNETFFLFKIYVRVKKLCHIWSATCDNAGTNTRRGVRIPLQRRRPQPGPDTDFTPSRRTTPIFEESQMLQTSRFRVF